MTSAAQAAQQLSLSVRAAFAVLAEYIALVIANNPHSTMTVIFAREDVAFEIDGRTDAAKDAAEAAVRQAWHDHGGPDGLPVLEYLVADARRAYDVSQLHHLAEAAYASVPAQYFVPGITPPGETPEMDVARTRAARVRAAVEQFARRATFSNSLSIDVAAGAARTEYQLHGAAERGEVMLKRWRAHIERPTCCHWCRNLDGRTIGLHEDFAPYLGPAEDLTGHGRVTSPPRPYRGRLPGPKLHPNCQCWLEIVPATVQPEGGQGPGQLSAPAAGFLAAADIRAMPEHRYRAMLAFLRAAVHELGQVLRRLIHHE